MEIIPSIGMARLSKSPDNIVTIAIAGNWQMREEAPSADDVQKGIEKNLPVSRIAFETSGLSGWDSSLLVFLVSLSRYCSRTGIVFDNFGLPEGIRRLVMLAMAVPEKKDAQKQITKESLLSSIGSATLKLGASFHDITEFIGSVLLSFILFMRGRANYRRVDLFKLAYECGAQALPIVSLISVLIGLILAFVGAIQLRMFGAQIYVADLVGIAMAREMGAMMTGIIMAGRTGAAFAAQIGTMQVNEEIDAFKTLGISPVEFLVMPRMTALVLMMPLLCLYADFVGIVGGFLVGVGMLHLSFMEYYNETVSAVSLTNCSIGLMKGLVFGILIALSGCLRGMQCGRSASAVGAAATSAVVTAIVWIIVMDAVFAVLTQALGI